MIKNEQEQEDSASATPTVATHEPSPDGLGPSGECQLAGAVKDALSALAWIELQAESVMRISCHLTGDLAEAANSTASDIVINAQMASEKLSAALRLQARPDASDVERVDEAKDERCERCGRNNYRQQF